MPQRQAASREGAKNIHFDRLPDRCPICHCGICPIDTGQVFATEVIFEWILRCPRQECDHFFVARYVRRGAQGSVAYYDLVESVPKTLVGVSFDELISNISPDFVAIYKQAHQAEQTGLNLVSGPGYRKALEFLIKDYSIRLHQTDGDKIKAMTLVACIKNYVKNDRIIAVSSRAVWLGNDETHYLRKWEGKDLQDLKNLIELTVHWIEMEELTATIIKEMPESGATKTAAAGSLGNT